jgi:CRP-like cAMP-binding protein
MILSSPMAHRAASAWGREQPQADCRQGQHFNGLLAALPDSVRERWRYALQAVHLPRGRLLSEPGIPTSKVYFPTSAIVSLVKSTQLGQPIEIAVIGSEGMVGTWLCLGSATTAFGAVVQSAGNGYCMEARHLMQEFNQPGPVLQLMLRYIQALLTQTAQYAACTRHHSVLQKLCRSLLLNLDRLPSQSIPLTQESIAHTLGVRRATVTGAAATLRRAGVIKCHPGCIEVLSRAQLENYACECYAVVDKEYRRLLPVGRAAGADAPHAALMQ